MNEQSSTNGLHDKTIQYDILIEKISSSHYSARAILMPDLVVEAATREEAIKQIRMALLARLAKTEVVTLEFTEKEIDNPWLKFAGMWKDNEDFDEFQAHIQRYRREVDEKWAPWLFENEEEQGDPKSDADDSRESVKEMVLA